MNILAIDTSTQQASIALGNEQHLQSVLLDSNLVHSQTLLPAIEKHCDLSQIQALAFNLGPGAFTGLRHSAASIQALALALNVPIFGVLSFWAMALPFLKDNQTVNVFLDARMNQVYCATFEGFQLKTNAHLQDISNLASFEQSHTLCIGNVHLPFVQYQQVQAQNVARAVFLGFAQTLTPENALPVYVRNKVAQTILERKQC